MYEGHLYAREKLSELAREDRGAANRLLAERAASGHGKGLFASLKALVLGRRRDARKPAAGQRPSVVS